MLPTMSLSWMKSMTMTQLTPTPMLLLPQQLLPTMSGHAIMLPILTAHQENGR